MTTPVPLGLGHCKHPLLGRAVLDTATGRVGVLRAIAPEPNGVQFVPSRGLLEAPPVAWLAPEGGGTEWTTDPDEIEAAP
ncbi:hypothetical protein AB0D04_08640 [Streptomyces sp. NPDC048483]|uniref:hypothetical protein n=1 Tax=Streptomyces sp. NPDC048483 TaxID=3154927 RepID=UPI0034297902